MAKKIDLNRKRLPQDAPFVIYALVHPLTHEPFYVGCSNDLYGRVGAHLSTSRRCRDDEDAESNRHLLIRDMLLSGTFPGVLVLEHTTKEFATEREAHWMRILESRGIKLENSFVVPPTERQQLESFAINATALTLLEVAVVHLQASGHEQFAARVNKFLDASTARFETKRQRVALGRSA